MVRLIDNIMQHFSKTTRMVLLIFKWSVVIFIVGLMMTRGHLFHKTDTQPTDYFVGRHSLHQALYFKGIIQPLKETMLLSPIDAVIEQIHSHYGQSVDKGDRVFTLKSSVFEKQYHATFSDYLAAKDNFNTAQMQFNSTQELWDMGLISKNNYTSEKSGLNIARLATLQATQKLIEMQEKMGINQDLSTLDVTQLNQIQDALNRSHNTFQLNAPASGVLLDSSKMSTSPKKRIYVTANVKAGDVVSVIGDLSGIHVNMAIPEVSISKIHIGMPAHITGAALDSIDLEGQVVRIDTQATPGSSGPYFNVTVEVARLSTKQRASIKIGMSVAIELRDSRENQLLIPIGAIQRIDGKAMLTIQNKNGVLEQRPVKTGAATANQVVILKGVNVGEHIVYR